MKSLRAFWASYESILHAHPVRTQAVTTGILWTIGDTLAQKAVEKKPVLDRKRLLATGAYATAVVGPVGNWWYGWLDMFARRHFVPKTLKFVAAKVVIDEVVFTPFHVGIFFALLTAVDGGGFAEIKAKLKQDYLSTLATELIVWPGFQFLNFWKVPLQHQLLAANGATILDSTFLSWARSQDDWLASATALLRPATADAQVTAESGQQN
mmetsp:Transcript_14732/g.44507  ORF Transcript_14732/g.44507 Transcript_14732/m.44507 type:complete len:210 (-) Transcript_14732:1461-2090(-)|eukprot:CAMPEP_0206134626 /NCGR_PEP_ID=MMETSP1473-20131121/117_1 /ASSEMBLY_ACC=CAM_ASM_001109 /TAXON_ID=1461547 /ORGANISM="Stichococcus sp, Strain RCC1054" /LENGTH=209 /DNA_ID=CAMNT_0053526243 /DNA_START=277 /DNA_END=906 /DNA_ORIENTATION=+